MAIEKIVIVTKKTPLEELIERYNTREQARFYIEHLGQNFDKYEAQHETYKRACAQLKAQLPRGVRTQWIERENLPMFGFGDDDTVATIGPDGLVVNLAKYLRGQTVVAFNPDPRHIDGVLLPFRVEQAPLVWQRLANSDLPIQDVTMARARTADGQQILAVNDLFIGASSHVAARYQINYRGRSEAQISSGVIVSTGAGSTGWRRSIVCGAAKLCGENAGETNYRFALDARKLEFCVREPFESLASGADIVAGEIKQDETLDLVSQMPQGGVIFGDGVIEDFIEWNAGVAVSVGVADEVLRLARA